MERTRNLMTKGFRLGERSTYSDLFFSKYTHRLIITMALPTYATL